MIKANRKIVIARIGVSFKLSGEFKLFSWADPIESVFDLSPWLIKPSESQIKRLTEYNPNFFSNAKKLEDDFYPITKQTGRVIGKNLISKIKGIDSPEAISVLTNCQIYVYRSSLKEIEDGNYYWCDLIGLEVINQQNQSLGRVKKLTETKANSILEIKSSQSKENLLIPFIDQFIKKVDLENGKISVHWDE